MKKLTVLLLGITVALSLTACNSANNNTTEQPDSQDNLGINTEENLEPNSEIQSETNNLGNEIIETDPETEKATLNILSSIWDSYTDDERFPVAGGDFSSEHSVMDGPGIYSLSDWDALNSNLGYPVNSPSAIDSAASLMHMMNANTFTSGAYHMTIPENAPALAQEIQKNLQGRQWICGVPDKLIIVQVDDFIITAFGETELVDTYKNKISTVYSHAEVLYDEPIQ